MLLAEMVLFAVAPYPMYNQRPFQWKQSAICPTQFGSASDKTSLRGVSKSRRSFKQQGRHLTVFCVGANESNPLAWALNGVGSLTASAWGAVASRFVATKESTDRIPSKKDGDRRDVSQYASKTASPQLSTRRIHGSGAVRYPQKIERTSVASEKGAYISSTISNESEKDDDGLRERLAVRSASNDENDGVQARLRARRVKDKQQSRAAKVKTNNKNQKGGPFFFIGKRGKKSGAKNASLTQISPSLEKQLSYGGISRSQVFALVSEGLKRQPDETLDTLLPYDLQRSMFSDLCNAKKVTVRTERPSGTKKTFQKSFQPTVSMSRDALRPVSVQSSAFTADNQSFSTFLLRQVQRDIEDYDPAVGSGTATKINKSRGQRSRQQTQQQKPQSQQSPFGWLFFWRRGSSSEPQAGNKQDENRSEKSKGAYATKDASEQQSSKELKRRDEKSQLSVAKDGASRASSDASSKGNTASTSGLLTVPLAMVGDLLQAVWSVRDQGNSSLATREGQGSEEVAAYAAAMTRDSNALDESDPAGGGAAFAFAAASAIASSSASYELDAVEAAGLHASVSAARAISTTDDADVFIATVGVGALVTAARILKGRARSSALTALANIAILCPKSRKDMLLSDRTSIGVTIGQILQTSDRFAKAVSQVLDRNAALCLMEALVSGTHLLGSLALANGATGAKFRRLMAKDAMVVQALRRLAGGLKSGEPEGAARAARRALGALGINIWTPRVTGQRGLRILSIDGGGTRAIMAFEMLKHLKKITGCEIHEMFDVIGGTSTGAIVAASLGIAHKTVEDVEVLYRTLIGRIFAKHPVNGPKMLLTRAYYDTRVFEDILKKECGTGVFIDSVAEENVNKVFVVSSIMSRTPHELHVFRNYTYPLGHESRYAGTAEAQVWEALRASSAAPTFFSEIKINGELHADGAIVANNPAAVALHEVKCMYPGVPIEIVVSMGNGNSETDVSAAQRKAAEEGMESSDSVEEKLKAVGWGEVVGSIVASATSTEAVHHALSDLFPQSKYFRFNPPTRSTEIDEVRPEKLADFVSDATRYIENNSERFAEAARTLRPKTSRSLWRRFRDALAEELQALSSIEDDVYLI